MSFDSIIARLETSVDATDRVKAAAELGEVGDPEVAPFLLKTVWEDSQSGVRQAAVTSYIEVLKEKAMPELEKIIFNHFDSYVRMNAVSMLPKLDMSVAVKLLRRLLDSEDEKIRAMAIRELYFFDDRHSIEKFMQMLEKETYHLALRNILEALALWKAKDSYPLIKKLLQKDLSNEVKTLAHLALAIFGDRESAEFLKSNEADSSLRIKYDNEWFRGKDGLWTLVEKLSD